MGLQMCNDPNYGLPSNLPKSLLWNVLFMKDMFAIATKDIKKGKELFADYQMTDEEDDNEQDDSEDGSGDDEEDDNNNDEWWRRRFLERLNGIGCAVITDECSKD